MDMTKHWVSKKQETTQKTDGLTHCSQEATTMRVFLENQTRKKSDGNLRHSRVSP